MASWVKAPTIKTNGRWTTQQNDLVIYLMSTRVPGIWPRATYTCILYKHICIHVQVCMYNYISVRFYIMFDWQDVTFAVCVLWFWYFLICEVVFTCHIWLLVSDMFYFPNIWYGWLADEQAFFWDGLTMPNHQPDIACVDDLCATGRLSARLVVIARTSTGVWEIGSWETVNWFMMCYSYQLWLYQYQQVI